MNPNEQKRMWLGELERLEQDLQDIETPGDEKLYLKNKIDELNSKLEELKDGS
jgi:hypothetical protein